MLMQALSPRFRHHLPGELLLHVGPWGGALPGGLLPAGRGLHRPALHRGDAVGAHAAPALQGTVPTETQGTEREREGGWVEVRVSPPSHAREVTCDEDMLEL